jgi:hypothetical protein
MIRENKKRILVVAILMPFLFAMSYALYGCSGKAAEPFNDAPVSGENTGSAVKINMPDGFSNVATKCDNGNRIYVAFHGDKAYASIAVVPADPSCS